MTAVQPARGRPPSRKGAPHGEQAVRASLIDAAAELFAARGPARVSVREVADVAGVNHGLVHHYFGSKDGLLRAVLEGLAGQAAAEVADWDGGESLFVEGGATARHGRIVAQLLLEARDLGSVQTEFPAVHALMADLRARGLSDGVARERAAQVTALVLGWQLFEPFLSAAAGLEVDERERSRVLREAVRSLLASR